MQLSDTVRETATKQFVKKSLGRGEKMFSIKVSDLKAVLERSGFPRNHTPQICSALRSGKFLRNNNLELVSIDGPPSQTSTTVVFHYRFDGREKSNGGPLQADEAPAKKDISKDPRWIAFQSLKGVLKEAYRPFGGGEAYLKSFRREFERKSK